MKFIICDFCSVHVDVLLEVMLQNFEVEVFKCDIDEIVDTQAVVDETDDIVDYCRNNICRILGMYGSR
jgi:hypothetical protein